MRIVFVFLGLGLLTVIVLSQPAAEDMAPTDIEHSVPLEDIIFDDFDARSNRALPYTLATKNDVERLRDRIIPLCQQEDLAACIEPSYASIHDEEMATTFDDDLVIGYVAEDGQAYAYPFAILRAHEIVNETYAGVPVAVTYCPLCNSAVVFSRIVNDQDIVFGNTSALYQSDMVMYDVQTESYWVQAEGKAILGELTDEILEVLPSVVTTYTRWQTEYPDSLVLACPVDCFRYAGGTFGGGNSGILEEIVNDGNFIFPVDRQVSDDTRLPYAEVVLVVDGEEESIAYPLQTLGNTTITDELDDDTYVVLIEGETRTAAVYRNTLNDGTILQLVYDDGDWVDADSDTRFTVGGLAIEGEYHGEQLEAIPSRYLFWFSAVATTENLLVYDSDE